MTRSEQLDCLRAFLRGAPETRLFVRLDPSSFAATFAGRPGGRPTVEEEVAFHKAFPNDAVVNIPSDYAAVLPQLAWERKPLRQEPDGIMVWEETFPTPGGLKRRIISEPPGTTPWLLEPPVKNPEDFDLIDVIADTIRTGAAEIARASAHYPPMLAQLGILPGATILSAFEVYWLVAYPDMPLFFMDHPARYLASVRRVHAANMALLEAFAGVGFEHFMTGSAGLELLSPRIFKEAIVPFQREFHDRARELGCFTSHHICGHTSRLIEMGIIDDIRPTIFETCSPPPCGDNENLKRSVERISPEIITKGNLALELLRNGTPGEIQDAVARIIDATRGRPHIIGQADVTILDGTPHENIRAFVTAVSSRWRTIPS